MSGSLRSCDPRRNIGGNPAAAVYWALVAERQSENHFWPGRPLCADYYIDFELRYPGPCKPRWNRSFVHVAHPAAHAIIPLGGGDLPHRPSFGDEGAGLG